MNPRSKWACIFSIEKLLAGGWAYLWTLTTPDEVDLKELSKRWRKLIWNGFTPCVRVFEKHPGGHGYHVHFVTAERIDVEELRPKSDAAGFGRIHVKRIPGRSANYVAKYVSKQHGEPGVRMWACVGFEGSKVGNIVIHDTRKDEIKMVMQRFPSPSTYNFAFRWELAEKTHRKLFWHAATHESEPGYESPFPALFRKWKNDPLCSIGKPAQWWTATSQAGQATNTNLTQRNTQ